MTTFAEREPTLGGAVYEIGIDGNDVGGDLGKPKGQFSKGVFSLSADNDHTSFEDAGRRDNPHLVRDKGLFEKIRVGLAVQNPDDR